MRLLSYVSESLFFSHLIICYQDLMVDLEHRVFKTLKNIQWLQGPIYVGVSGGLDSVGLLVLLVQLRKSLERELKVFHFHHGSSLNVSSLDFRNQAYEFVKTLCLELSVEFCSNKIQGGEPLMLSNGKEPSEQELRDLRYQYFETHFSGSLVLAHHAEDLFETRLIRLIRGTGPQGLFAMKIQDSYKVRPLLGVLREDLKQYLKSKDRVWLEDPSNSDLDPMRNWLRKEWLPQLENYRTGATRSFARSLDLICQRRDDGSELLKESIVKHKISKPIYYTLSKEEQRQVLAQYIYQLGIKNYGLSHINELIKRLDKLEKSHNFSLLKCDWQVSPEWIQASPKAAF